MIYSEARNLSIGSRMYDFDGGWTVIDVQQGYPVSITLMNDKRERKVIVKDAKQLVCFETHIDVGALTYGTYCRRADDYPLSFPVVYVNVQNWTDTYQHYLYVWYGRTYHIIHENNEWHVKFYDSTPLSQGGFTSFGDALAYVWDLLDAVLVERRKLWSA